MADENDSLINLSRGAAFRLGEVEVRPSSREAVQAERRESDAPISLPAKR